MLHRAHFASMGGKRTFSAGAKQFSVTGRSGHAKRPG